MWIMDFFQNAGECAGVLPPKKDPPKIFQALAVVGGIVVGLTSLYYSVSSYGPTASTLVGSGIIGGLTYLTFTAMGCAWAKQPLISCAIGDFTGLVSGSFSMVSKGILGFDLNPDKFLGKAVNELFGAIGC